MYDRSLMSLTLLLALAAWVSAAPVPPPKVRPAPELSGQYNMYFHGEPWLTTLLPDGTYLSEKPGLRYEGKWEISGAVFTVRERQVGPSVSPWMTYRFTLRNGQLRSTCGQMRLEKRP